MLNRDKVRVFIFVTILLGIAAAFLIFRKNDVTALQILSTECERACWNGIEPGITTQSTVKETLLREGITYKPITGLVDEQNGLYEWSTQVQGQNTLVTVSFVDGVVAQITLPLKECISTVITQYGEPPKTSLGKEYSYLLYPEHGLVFSVYSGGDPSHVSVIFLTSPVTFSNFSAGELLDWSNARSKFSDECA